tara:strand:+ start:75 stop:548 length:474 start_codon:yes stop_codon:yes gene_type:complete
MNKHDEIIECPKSGGDLCYKVEVTKDITNYMSLSCGFWTNSLMTSGSDFYNEQMGLLPDLYIDLAWEDPETKYIWLPNTINIPEQGMVYADSHAMSGGLIEHPWSWAAVKARKLTPEEQEKDAALYKPDMTTIKHFLERDYMEALSYIGVLPPTPEN